jgi:hypothetical protein
MTCTVATGNAVTKDKTYILIFASYFNCTFGLHLKFGLPLKAVELAFQSLFALVELFSS